MGSEQSSRREREYRGERTDRESAATAKDVEKALEQQRKMYEQRIQELIRENKPAPTPTTTGQQTLSNNNLERQRNPYCYNQNDLQGAIRNPYAPNLYPSLGNSGYSTLSPPNTATPSFGNHNVNPASFNTSYVNNHIGVGPRSPSQVPPNFPHPPQRNQPQSQPSAPPAPVETSFTNSRSRSHSRQRGNSPNDDITCKTCGNMYGDKIYQCNQGHSSCNSCKTRQAACGQCRQHLTNRRNFDLEKYVAERRVKCPNSADGCCLYIKGADMETHTKECPFKPLQCPSLENCRWEGKLPQLLQHFDTMHSTHRQADVDKEMFLSNVDNTSHTMHFVQIGSFNFLFHIKVSEADRRMYAAVQLIGTKHSAAKWDYEVHVYNKSQPRRKYTYFDRCASSNEPIEEIFESTKCAVIPQGYAKTFICGGVIAYKFFIKRDENLKKTKEFVYNKRGRGRGARHKV